MNRVAEESPALLGRLCGFLARYGPALLLAGYLLLAHGCHGDEDNELFTAAAKPQAARGTSG
jgi:hypothetical protein